MTTHTPVPAQEAVLTGDEVRKAVAFARSMTAPSDVPQPGEYVLAGALAALSKLRAPVADERAAESHFEDELERAYWEMDARIKGLGQHKGRPQPDRDAFKWAVRGMRPMPPKPFPERICICCNVPRNNCDCEREAPALASAPVSVPDECTNKLVSAHYRRGWNACRAEMLSSASAPVAGEAQQKAEPSDKDILALAGASTMFKTGTSHVDGLPYYWGKGDTVVAFARTVLAQYAAPQASKPHEVAALVSRLWNVAEKYHGTQQLRDRISHEILPLLAPQASEAVPDAGTAVLDDVKLPTLPPITHTFASLISPSFAEALQNWARTYTLTAILADRQQRARGVSPTLLASTHMGMRVDYRGLLHQARADLGRNSALAEMLRQLQEHLRELGQRWYAGDTAVVDELLQLYCVESEARAALSAQPGAQKKGGSDA